MSDIAFSEDQNQQFGKGTVQTAKTENIAPIAGQILHLMCNHLCPTENNTPPSQHSSHWFQCLKSSHLHHYNSCFYILYTAKHSKGKTSVFRVENGYSLEKFCGSMLVDLHCLSTKP